MTFNFGNQPVGLIEAVDLAALPSRIMYEPFRGPGHYRFQQALKQNGKAICTIESEAGTMVFIVVGIDVDGRLIIETTDLGG